MPQRTLLVRALPSLLLAALALACVAARGNAAQAGGAPVDMDPPVITIKSPPQQFIGNPVHIRVDITDASAISWDLLIDGDVDTSGTNKGTDAISLDRVLSGGQHEVRVEAMDDQGNTQFQFVTFTITTGEFSASAAKLNFGKIKSGKSAFRTLKIKNKGTVPMAVNVGAGTSPFGVTAAGGDNVVPPKQSITVVVEFKPETARQTFSGTLHLTTSDPNRPTVDVPLLGKTK